jgi:iron complex transport system permease protein
MAAVAARPPSLRTRSPRVPLVLGALAVAALAAGLLDALSGRSGVEPLDALRLLVAPDGSADADLVQSVRLPRAVAALACGAALGLAGALIQAVVRNPLAEPGTIGVANGAGLAIAVAGVAGVPLGALGSVPVAFAGGLAAAAIVIGVAGGLRADPVRLVLAGVAISFACAAGMTALKILNEQWAFGMQLWSAGTVEQPGWGPLRALGWAIPVLAAASLVLARDLDALDLGDDAAAGLGVRPARARVVAGLVALLLASLAVALTGPLAFVGLAAPHLARRLGLHGHRLVLLGAAAAGAALLPLADAAALVLTHGEQITAGVVCALVGAPVLIAIARSAPVRAAPSIVRRAAGGAARRRLPPVAGPLVAAAVTLASLVAALAVGEVALGPADVVRGVLGQGESAFIVQELRLPRALVAAAAGAALALCGALLQGATRNPLAGPELIGVTGGATVGGVAVLLVSDGGAAAIAAGAFAGGIAALVLVAVLAPPGLPPARVALIGVALASAFAALVEVLLLRAGNELDQGMVFLAGSTYAEGWTDLAPLLAVLVPAAAVAWLLARRLDVLGAGDDVAVGLGVPPPATRAALLVLAAVLAAAAVATVGAVGFVGLMAPHAARLLVGSGHRRLLPVAAALGGALLLVADLVGRSALDASREVPSGIVTALLGAPLLLWLLRRRA